MRKTGETPKVNNEDKFLSAVRNVEAVVAEIPELIEKLHTLINDTTLASQPVIREFNEKLNSLSEKCQDVDRRCSELEKIMIYGRKRFQWFKLFAMVLMAFSAAYSAGYFFFGWNEEKIWIATGLFVLFTVGKFILNPDSMTDNIFARFLSFVGQKGKDETLKPEREKRRPKDE